MIRRPPRSTHCISSAASDVYKRQEYCSQNFVDNIKAGGCLDIHHQDQLLLYMALAKGKSQIRVGAAISDHTQAVIYILQKFLPQLKTSVMPQKEKDLIIYNIIEIEGIAYENK
eukprot:TRINITY_DN10807_c0_g1_i1.p2 TRINITY_DN10807_c0_g1~~TRINITY_DN10807_c0_g1_i1.p2  ORF type:complete len:114 (+),score=33.76 TRINITY_DN10807_c0_g1_i1:73-414(+)